MGRRLGRHPIRGVFDDACDVHLTNVPNLLELRPFFILRRDWPK